MKIYLTPPQPSLGLERIATALRRYAPPSVTIHTFPNISNNDLTVIYAIGRRDSIERQCRKIIKSGKKYAIIQICLRSTMNPRVDHWLQSPEPDDQFEGIWLNAQVVWSYYDLNRLCVEDGWSLEHDGDSMFRHGQFYHAPLGADANTFWRRDVPEGRHHTILTSGVSRLQESVRECWIAANEVGGSSVHLGQLADHNGVTILNHVSDNQLSIWYSRCQFVSGLRRKEGFELPAVEGLLCGARPIVFDTPDYRWNYGPHAEYIRETDRQGVVDQLVELFKRGARPVTAEEREQAVERFNWETIVRGFYERLQ